MLRSNQILVLALILTFGLIADVSAQARRRSKSKSRRTTGVARPQPVSSPSALEPEIVSRAEDEINAGNGSTRGTGINPDLPKNNPNRSGTSAVVAKGKNKSVEEKEDLGLLYLERLSLAEGRAESFRKQLSDVIEREAALHSKLEQLDYQMRPDMIQAETATVGSLRPEEVREARRKILENEKTRTSEQLNKIVENRTRLETAVANADALVDKLRARVESETNSENQKAAEKITAKDSAEPNNPDN